MGLKYLLTSGILLLMQKMAGLSCPSMAPYCMAVNASAISMGTGSQPSRCQISI